MKIKKSIIAMVMLLSTFVPKANAAITLQNIKDLIGKYCYPLVEDCGTAYEPVYSNSDSKCICHNTTHQYYNQDNRKCELKCPAGQVVKATSKCPAGMYQFKIKRIDE